MDLVIKPDWSVNSSAVPVCENARIEMSWGVAWEYCPCAAVNSYEGRVRPRMISAAVVRDFLIIVVIAPTVVSAMVAPCV